MELIAPLISEQSKQQEHVNLQTDNYTNQPTLCYPKAKRNIRDEQKPKKTTAMKITVMLHKVGWQDYKKDQGKTTLTKPDKIKRITSPSAQKS